MAPIDLFLRPADQLARDLIGGLMLVDGVGGRIVETEAYDRDDPASHAFRGPTPRNAPMFGPPGRAYVYRIYGLHWCFNVVCDGTSQGSAVLIRALEPTHGLAVMRDRRGVEEVRNLCSGPGKLCQALAIDSRLNGASVLGPTIEISAPSTPQPVAQGVRIGIRRGVETPWRFALSGSRFLSQPMPLEG